MSNPDSIPDVPPATANVAVATTAMAAAAAARFNSRRGRSNYSTNELIHMLKIIEKIKPIGQHDWENVLKEHSVVFPGRDVASMRRKFASVASKKCPTGDPNCPEEVKIAKKARLKISQRADIGDGEEKFSLELGQYTTSLSQLEEEDSSNEDYETLGSGEPRPLVQPRVGRGQRGDSSSQLLQLMMLQKQEAAEARAEARAAREAAAAEAAQARAEARVEARAAREATHQLVEDVASAIASTVAEILKKNSV